MVLFLFVIMLVNLDEAAKLKQFNAQLPIAVVAILGAAGTIYWFLTNSTHSLGEPASKALPSAGNVENVADMLFSQYLLPFEIASVLLLVAVVGSVLMARKRTE